MAFVPITVPNKRRNGFRSRSGSIFIIVVIGLVFLGLLFFFMFDFFGPNRSGLQIVSLFSGFTFVIIIIIGISAISMALSETYKKPKKQYITSYNFRTQSRFEPQNQKQTNNPYIINKSFQNQNELEQQKSKEIKRDNQSFSSINFCRFCGAKIDPDAIFCHQCGIKVSS